MALHTLRHVARRAAHGAGRVAGIAANAIDAARPLYTHMVRPALMSDHVTRPIVHKIDAGLAAYNNIRAAHGLYQGVRGITG